jgi:hypothetical protein
MYNRVAPPAMQIVRSSQPSSFTSKQLEPDPYVVEPFKTAIPYKDVTSENTCALTFKEVEQNIKKNNTEIFVFSMWSLVTVTKRTEITNIVA